MALTKAQSLRQAIAREQALLADLAHKHHESRERLAALKTALAVMESTPAVSSAPSVPCPPQLFPDNTFTLILRRSLVKDRGIVVC